MGMLFFENSKLLPAFYQYQFMPSESFSESTFKEALEGKIVPINKILLKNTNLVYTGVKLQKIHQIDLNHSTYDVEFLIWF